MEGEGERGTKQELPINVKLITIGLISLVSLMENQFHVLTCLFCILPEEAQSTGEGSMEVSRKTRCSRPGLQVIRCMRGTSIIFVNL